MRRGLEHIACFSEFRRRRPGSDCPGPCHRVALLRQARKAEEGLAPRQSAGAAVRNGEHQWQAELARLKGALLLPPLQQEVTLSLLARMPSSLPAGKPRARSSFAPR